MADDSLIFSEPQQQAVIAHALQVPSVWELLKETKIDETWFISAALKDTWVHLQKFYATYERLPKSIDELADSVTDDLLKSALKRSIAKCVESKKRYPWDALEKKLVDWAKARALYVNTKEIATLWNAGKQNDAYKLLQETVAQIEKIEATVGLEPDGFVSAAVRAEEEEVERLADSKRVVEYAVPYLQDSSGGMLPTDITLVGATSGAGKTEFAKIQAEHSSAKGLNVHYFALEAEPMEIERRIKYGMISKWYKEDHPGTPPGMINYRNFRHSKIQELIEPYRKRASEEFKKKHSTLFTYYRKRKDFGIRELDKEVSKLKGQSDLVILDHIHFMDLETENETLEMSNLIKKLRQMSLSLGIPMILIAHINKAGGGRNAGLVPNKEDFYGAGNLFKTATQAIMMAPAHGLVTSDSRAIGKPTFMRWVKVRIDGSILWQPGISFFNPWTLSYSPYYSVGKLEKCDRKWSSIKGDLPYWVDMDRNIVDVSDIE